LTLVFEEGRELVVVMMVMKMMIIMGVHHIMILPSSPLV